ncbi:hypothetical protein QTH91_19695 [Variovorax dokdonensis]|uniref:Uncharacterized protein n=1 Tax=Variovorax dokdonensis TaxID=344883 RepID=A0ABT7NFK0_9BURK|nr:hypothetical protein [Variovorax dokdonensis]MDM0046724.1 hypothetical protein [Variovorax dokdonensis]
MKTTSFLRLLASTAVLAALAGTAAAQANVDLNKPAPSQRAHTIQQPPANSVSNGIQRGTNAAGRGVAKADHATRSGIAQGSAAASRPVRGWGDSLGRKLGLGTADSGPAKGPQSEMP